ncbi:DUF2797 domain-containing protein [bacterium]|nr:DUF2797 domain-containing protein [bacterium]
MKSQVVDDRVSYSFLGPGGEIALHVPSTVQIRDTGRRFCVSCGRQSGKLFGQGFCYPCFKNSPENAECIIRPELCRAHLGEGRDPDWERRHHNQPHHVYLANSGGLKVGVTRETQVPTRWIDQGASSAAVLATTPNRYWSGVIEVELKQFLSDKTNWQRMLKGQDPDIDLSDIHHRVQALSRPEWAGFLHMEAEVVTLRYPVIQYPESVKSIKLDTSPTITGELAGIRGQYLMFTDNRVLNIRNHSGYEVELTV